MRNSLFISIFIISLYSNIEAAEHKKQIIPLMRHKSATERIINAPEKYHQFYKWLEGKNNTNHSIPLKRFFDSEFYAPIVVGHPGKTYRMAIDTSWTYSWLMSSDCSIQKPGCWFHNKYNHRDSSSYVKNGTVMNFNEGEYNLTGYLSQDSFSIGQIRIDNQTFVEIDSVPYLYIFSKTDGVLGLGFKYNDYDPFFYNMLKVKSVSVPIFSIYMNRDKQSSRGGNVFLGYIEKKHIHSTNKKPDPILYVPVDGNGYWQFDMNKVIVNKAANIPPIILCANGCKAVVDSSNTLIVGPANEIKQIHEYMDAHLLFFGRYMVNCDTVNKLQPIDFIIGGKKFSLKNARYIQKMSLSSVTICISAFTAAESPQEQGRWVLGAAFLSEYFSIYDLQNKQIGFVKAA
nr:cathepsin D2 [Dermestes maculatus]